MGLIGRLVVLIYFKYIDRFEVCRLHKYDTRVVWIHIYGRYRRRFTNELAEEHFPITYNENGKRSDFIDELSAPSNIEVSDVGSEWV